MKLIDLIDLEAQLSRDRDVDIVERARRDASIGRSLSEEERADPERALVGWLDHVRESSERVLPGRAVARALRLVSAALLVMGLVSGWGAASVLLAYDGARPINVMDFLWAILGVQLVLLVLLVVSASSPGALARLPLVSDLRAGLALLTPRLAARLAGERGDAWAVAFHRMRGRRSLYARLEPWLILGVAQVFGLAFNLGVIFALLRLVALTDLAFAWTTTLEVEAATLHRIVSALSFPFAWAFPEARPSLELIEATRYSRQAGAYLAPSGPASAGGWWPFLLATTVTYGLLPRALALVIARVRRARLAATPPLDDLETRRLLARLTGPMVEIRGSDEPGAADRLERAAPRLRVDLGGSCVAVAWRDVPLPREALEGAVRDTLGAGVVAVVAAGGAEAASNQGAIEAVARADAPVLFVAEAWEPPDKSVLRFVRELRSAVGPRRPILVGLLGAPRPSGWDAPAAADVAVWGARVMSLEDPFVGVESLGEES